HWNQWAALLPLRGTTFSRISTDSCHLHPLVVTSTSAKTHFWKTFLGSAVSTQSRAMSPSKTIPAFLPARQNGLPTTSLQLVAQRPSAATMMPARASDLFVS